MSHIREIQSNNQAWNNLFLPADYKQLVQAFVKSQIEDGCGFDDIVDGKGGLGFIPSINLQHRLRII